MNYRHAFHAGNFADVMKHAILARVLAYLALKDAPFRAVDTHAGRGVYDLAGGKAQRTGEAAAGVRRLEEPFAPEIEALLEPYRAALAATRARHGPSAYPGSPAIIRNALRRGDRGVFVELHPVDGARLAGLYETDARTKVMALDGWTALGSLIPPKERRGLVLVDPPYEAPDELEHLGGALLRAVAKWPTGVFLGWYPIKDEAPVAALVAELDARLTRPALRLELRVDRIDGTRLAGSGLVVVNPPWTLKAEAGVLLPALAGRLGQGRGGGVRAQAIGAPA